MDRFAQNSALRSTTPVGMDELRHRIETFMQRFSANHVPKDPMEQEIDRIISKKIMEHLNEFFTGSRPSPPSIKIKSSRLHAPHATNATNTLKLKMKMKTHKTTMKKKS
jgi:hypothetical protein